MPTRAMAAAIALLFADLCIAPLHRGFDHALPRQSELVTGSRTAFRYAAHVASADLARGFRRELGNTVHEVIRVVRRQRVVERRAQRVARTSRASKTRRHDDDEVRLFLLV